MMVPLQPFQERTVIFSLIQVMHSVHHWLLQADTPIYRRTRSAVRGCRYKHMVKQRLTRPECREDARCAIPSQYPAVSVSRTVGDAMSERFGPICLEGPDVNC